MTETFKVGDIAVIMHSYRREWPVGLEVTILGPLEPAPIGPSHHIGWQGFQRVLALPSSLRKKQPPAPREQVSTWGDVIVWRPKETSHV